MSDMPPIAQHRRRPVASEMTADAAPGPGPGRLLRDGRQRKPFGNMVEKLRYPSREGYHRHWFNDHPGRIQQAQDAGYEQVMDENGKPVSYVVGVARGGGALTAYLMEIPIEWYREDMAAQEEVVQERLGQIKRGELGKKEGDGRYIAQNQGGIRIEENTGRR